MGVVDMLVRAGVFKLPDARALLQRSRGRKGWRPSATWRFPSFMQARSFFWRSGTRGNRGWRRSLRLCAWRSATVSDTRLHNSLLQLRARPVWRGRASRCVGPELCDLLGAGSSQPVVVTALPLRSNGMGLEVCDVRKTTNNAPVTQIRATPLAALCR